MNGREKKFHQKEREAYYTSPILAECLARKALDCYEGDLSVATFLEPSAGSGTLVDAFLSEFMERTGQSRDDVLKRCTLVEIDTNASNLLREKYNGATIINDNFILMRTRERFDIVLLNPPWSTFSVQQSDFYERYMPRLRGMSSVQKEKIYKEHIKSNNLEREYLEWYTGKRDLHEKYKREEPLAKNFEQMFFARTLRLLSNDGIAGMLSGDSIVNDSKTTELREVYLKKARYVYRFHNEKKLFEDVHDCTQYTMTVFGSRNVERFTLIDNLYHPKTIECCETERNEAPYPGTKNSEGAWDLRGHPQRVIHVDKALLEALAVFTGSTNPWHSVLPTLHGQPEKELFIKLGKFPKMKSVEYSYYRSIDETAAPKKGLITRAPGPYPSNEMVLTGPNIFVGNPSAKEPNAGCKHNQDFTATNLCTIADDFLPQTVYRLTEAGKKSPEYLKKTPWGTVHNEEFRVAARFMLNTTGMRTLSSAVIAPKMTHIHGVMSLSFQTLKTTVLVQSCFNSIILDFLLRNIGVTNFLLSTVQVLPIIPLSCENNLLVQALAARTLRLNCISNHYAPLYQEIVEAWGTGLRMLDLGNMYADKMDACFVSPILPGTPQQCGYGSLPTEWSAGVPLRRFEEREQALCETDALVAILFGISKEHLLNLYRAQFAVLQKNFQDFPGQVPKKGRAHFPRYAVMSAVYDCIESFIDKYNNPLRDI